MHPARCLWGKGRRCGLFCTLILPQNPQWVNNGIQPPHVQKNVQALLHVQSPFDSRLQAVGKVIRMQALDLLHRLLVAAQVAFQRTAQLLGIVLHHGIQDAGMGRAYGLVLVGLQAELADALHMLQAGAGIVADSVPENEYNECCNKVMALAKTLVKEDNL